MNFESFDELEKSFSKSRSTRNPHEATREPADQPAALESLRSSGFGRVVASSRVAPNSFEGAVYRGGRDKNAFPIPNSRAAKWLILFFGIVGGSAASFLPISLALLNESTAQYILVLTLGLAIGAGLVVGAIVASIKT